MAHYIRPMFYSTDFSRHELLYKLKQATCIIWSNRKAYYKDMKQKCYAMLPAECPYNKIKIMAYETDKDEMDQMNPLNC